MSRSGFVVAATSWTGATGVLAWLALAAGMAALVPAGLRWLRVAQREHYLPGSVTTFAFRWWSSEPANWVLAVLALGGAAAAIAWPPAALVTVAIAASAPLHLSVRGRTSPLRATRRLRTLAALSALLALAGVAVGALFAVPAPAAAAVALFLPLLVDLACFLLAPLERRALQRFVSQAAERLEAVSPIVVGITGSYGKTSTKQHLAHLLEGTRSVVASPASFNNRAGLARAVNEQLAPGTEVFIAEMGTYGPGEIAELCRWCPPEIAVLTAIGPVHLERFGSEEAILLAKSEILGSASTVVLNVDDPRLAELAARLADVSPSSKVISCSATDERADVCVRRTGSTVSLCLAGRCVAAELPVETGAQASNLACAVGVALELGVGPEALVRRLRSVRPAANRLTAGPAPSGVLVIDDTFNSNPAGARAALALLASSTGSGRRAVVTPGMVELGPRQSAENQAFAAAAGEVATDILVVGRTNRRALLRGAPARHPLAVRTRDQAVAWVRAHLGPGDVVLYENDLPDHYP